MILQLSPLFWAIWLVLSVIAHTVITYPGWRGDNLVTNETWPYGMQWVYPCKLGYYISLFSLGYDSRHDQIRIVCETSLFSAICRSSKSVLSWHARSICVLIYVTLGGDIQLTNNRTLWPVTGGAIAVQPGWFVGHALAFFRINLGLGNSGPDGGPLAMDIPLVPLFQFVGPSNNPFPGTMCFPDVSVPASTGVKVGDNATIQVILTAQHGASLFSVRLLYLLNQLTAWA
jgi:hypothetical protein